MALEHILLLEDSDPMREETRKILTDAGFRVQVAAKGQDALALAHHASFDLLLADAILPDITGIETFSRIRVIQPDIAGVIMTAYSSWDMAMDALRAGFVGFITKPFVPEQLVSTVVSAREQEDLRHENARLRALVPLYDLSRAFMETLGLGDLLNRIVHAVKAETKAETVSLMLLEDNHRELSIAAAAGLSDQTLVGTKRALGNSIAGRVAQSGEALMLAPDMPLDQEIRQSMVKPEILSALSLPLQSRGQVIGVLNLSRLHGAEPFKPGDQEFAGVLASQAAVAIDQARLFNDLKELSEISQRLASAIDLDEVSALIVDAPTRLVNARGAALFLIENAPPPTLKAARGLDNIPMPPLPRIQVVENYLADQLGWLTVPLRRGDKLFGALMILLPSPYPLGEERVGLLLTLGNTASAVIESHRLRARETNAFREVDRTVRADLNLRQVLERLLNQMIEACGAHAGAIFLWDADHGRVEPWIGKGLALDDALGRAVVQQGQAGLIAASSERTPAFIGAPMVLGTRVEGGAILTRAAGLEFSARHIELLSALTSTAALVVRNAQLYARSEEAAIAEERTRIARDMHDGILQDLSLLALKASLSQQLLERGKEKEVQKELKLIGERLRKDAREIRQVVSALRPLEIEALGFLPALEKSVKEFATLNEIDIQLQIPRERKISPKLETALFRLTQETLNNIRKHARAKHVWMDLVYEEQFVWLRVRDDGKGFDYQKALEAARQRGSVGLMQMRERVERAGGTFAIETAPGKGTRLEMKLPMRETV